MRLGAICLVGMLVAAGASAAEFVAFGDVHFSSAQQYAFDADSVVLARFSFDDGAGPTMTGGNPGAAIYEAESFSFDVLRTYGRWATIECGRTTMLVAKFDDRDEFTLLGVGCDAPWGGVYSASFRFSDQSKRVVIGEGLSGEPFPLPTYGNLDVLFEHDVELIATMNPPRPVPEPAFAGLVALVALTLLTRRRG